MKDMERQKFESEWKEAFEQAEISPSDNLWTSIELDLEREDGKLMRQRLLHYKLMAAASVVLAMCFAGVGFYYLNSQSQKELAVNSIVKNEFSNSNNIAANQNATKGKIQQPEILSQGKEPEYGSVDESKESSSDANLSGVQKSSNENSEQILLSSKKLDRSETDGGQASLTSNSLLSMVAENNLAKSDAASIEITDKNRFDSGNGLSKSNNDGASTITVAGMDDNNQNKSNQGNLMLNNESSPPTFTYRSLPALVNIPKIKLDLHTAEQEDPFKVMMARLEKREAELARGEEKKSKMIVTEKTWTSLGVSVGSFNSANSHVNSSTVNSSALSVSTVDDTSLGDAKNQSKASGTSYSAGLSVGTKVSERWVLQGGVNYMTQTSAYETHQFVQSNSSASFRVGAGASTLSDKEGKIYQAPDGYGVTNSIQYVGVPLQAGYVVTNRTLAVQINAGVSTDLFIQNTIAPQNSSTIAKVIQRGDDSPYRPVNFSGLIGTEISYRFGRHYRLALNPGLRYPVSSVYKSGTGVISNPITMDVGMRFRYIFH